MIKKIQLEILCQKGVHHSMKLKNDIATALMLETSDSSVVLVPAPLEAFEITG